VNYPPVLGEAQQICKQTKTSAKISYLVHQVNPTVPKKTGCNAAPILKSTDYTLQQYCWRKLARHHFTWLIIFMSQHQYVKQNLLLSHPSLFAEGRINFEICETVRANI
jgi:hypothetical protein